MLQGIDKAMVSKAVIAKIKEETEPNTIKAKHIADMETPNKISLKHENEGFVPDIAAEYNKQTSYYEIELEDDFESNKWRLFSLSAKNNNGSFFIVVPDFLKEKVKNKLDENDINAGLIFFNTEN